MQLTIEKLVYGGDGLARIPAPGDERRGKRAPNLPSVGRSGMKAVFASYVLPGEVVEAAITQERKSFSRASLVEVLVPSPARVAPRCPYFGTCGGCHYQHANYAAQLEAKRQILEETVLRGAKFSLPPIEVHSGPEYGYRNRTRMKVALEPAFPPQHAKSGPAGDPGFALGYYRHGSHELEPVRQCPISSPLINRAIQGIWDLADEARRCPALREVQFFVNHDDSQMLLELIVHPATEPEQMKSFARLLRERVPQIAGVAVTPALFRGDALSGELDDSLEVAPRPSGTGSTCVEGACSLAYYVGSHAYRVSAGSFFQTNRFLVKKLLELATANRSGRAALDLYAGVGLFTLPLARSFERVTAVEIAPSAYSDLEANAESQKTVGRRIHAVQRATEDFLNSARGQWDFAVVDPPRAGLGPRAAKALARLAIPRIAYVSCDPATLARDLATLTGAGYQVERAHLVDLFPQSYHMETILHLVR